MAKDKPAKYWRFKLDTRRKFTELSQEIARINSGGGGGGISELTSKMVVDALGYTPYNANNPANYITSAALTPYLKTEDAEDTYATKDFVNNKLVNYAPLTSVQGFENRIGGLEGAVPQLNERVETVESKVATLNETVSTGENNLLDRVNVIEQEYATNTYVDNAIDGIDLSAYLLKADLTKSRIQSTLGISDWALAATKPSYAWSEITSRPWGDYDLIHSGNISSQSVNYATSAGAASKCLGTYTNNGGEQYPSYVTGGTTRWNMMRNTTTYYDKQLYEGYCDWMLMDNYTGFDVPYVTGIGVLKGDATRAFIMSGAKGTNNKWKIKELATLDSNVASATKLQTPRSLWGQSFDGSANIGGDITLNALQDGCQLSIQQSGEIKFSTPPDNGWVTGLSIYASDKTTLLTSAFGVYGIREDVQYAFIGGTYDHPNVVVQYDTGYVGIGNASPAERLDVSGNIKASGNINATSITINGVTITASNGTITVNGNVFATGAITAKVVG